MRRLSGHYDNAEWVLFEYSRGMVECPMGIYGMIRGAHEQMPTGDALTEACRALFGATLVAREMPDDAVDRR